MRRKRRRGFTLVELLVVVGILAILMGFLLPALGKARAAGMTIKCAANLRSLGQGISQYLAKYKDTYPPAYTYRPYAGWKGPTDQVDKPANGYIHWSSYLYGEQLGKNSQEVFQCPSLERGGLPATDPPESEREPEQVNDEDFVEGSEIDAQALRCAYTVNEAIMPRNKFRVPIRGTSEYSQFWYKYVKFGMIKRPNEVVLATEFTPDWRVVSEVSEGKPPIVKSHRPVSGYYPIIGSGTDLTKDIIPTGLTHQRVVSVTNPVNPQDGVSNTLGWIGRNHGTDKRDAKGKDTRKTNFLYVDGHVETKTIEETLKPVFQWGDPERIYSLPGAAVKP